MSLRTLFRSPALVAENRRLTSLLAAAQRSAVRAHVDAMTLLWQHRDLRAESDAHRRALEGQLQAVKLQNETIRRRCADAEARLTHESFADLSGNQYEETGTPGVYRFRCVPECRLEATPSEAGK